MSSAKRVPKPLLAAFLVCALAGCAPDAVAGTQRVELDGILTQITASAGGRSWVLEVTGEGVLPLDLRDLQAPAMATGVVVEVPATIEMPEDRSGRFATLNEYVGETGESLVVLDFLP
jgi:hypothetical protein